MALAETAKLVASLELNDKGFSKGIKSAAGNLSNFSKAVARSRAVAVGVGVGLERIAEKGISALGGAIESGIAGAQELERVQQQTQAAIAATGGAAGVSATQVRDYAQALEDATTVDDKNIQAGEDVLLRYTQIGGKVFPKAAKAATDLAVALAKGNPELADTAAAAKIVGKALADPVKGITALRKAGIVLTKSQEDLIKKLVKSGKTEQAQGVILQELEKRYGKAGEAAAQGFGGDIRRANDAIEDAQIAIAQGLMPAVGEVARELTTVLKDPAVKNGLHNLGVGIGEAIKGLVAFAKTVPWGSIATSLQAAAGFAKDLLNAFLGLPDWVKTAVITGWGLNKLTGGALNDLIGTLASGLIKGVLGVNAGVVNINAATVTGVGAAGAAGGIPGFSSTATAADTGLKGLLKGLPIIGVGIAAAEIANATASAVAGAIKDAFPKEGTGDVVGNALKTVTGLFTGPLGIPNLAEGVSGLVGTVGDLVSVIGKQVDGGPGSQGDMESRRGAMADALQQGFADNLAGIEAVRGVAADKLAAVENAVSSGDHSLQEQVRTNADTVAAQVDSSGHGVASQIASTGSSQYAATLGGTASIVGAINAIPAPQTTVTVNVSGTTIDKKTTVTDRGGRTGGDRNTDPYDGARGGK